MERRKRRSSDSAESPPRKRAFVLQARVPDFLLKCFKANVFGSKDLTSSFNDVSAELTELLREELSDRQYKYALVVHLELEKDTSAGLVTSRPFFRSRAARILNDSEIETSLNDAFAQVSFVCVYF